jgi:5-methylcytosine-specific restriction endonuclease McrA
MPSGLRKDGSKLGFQKGHIVSLKMREKIGKSNSISLLGNIPWNKDKESPKVSGEKSNFWKGGKTVKKICPTCKKEFKVYRSQYFVECCSRRCARLGHKQSLEQIEKRTSKTRGKNHYNFQNWRSREPYGENWNNTLKEAIRQRDNYKCQICGCPQEECFDKLTIHHIDKIKTNLNPNNLISLCRKCHGKVHFNKIILSNKI